VAPQTAATPSTTARSGSSTPTTGRSSSSSGSPTRPPTRTTIPTALIAEDGEGKNHLVGATDDGETYVFARNELEGDNEFTGPTFSHNKKILFANIQSPGHVFAIQGPFRRQR
jgi:hypothetical protein